MFGMLAHTGACTARKAFGRGTRLFRADKVTSPHAPAVVVALCERAWLVASASCLANAPTGKPPASQREQQRQQDRADVDAHAARKRAFIHEKTKTFVDVRRVLVKAGDGGNANVTWRRQPGACSCGCRPLLEPSTSAPPSLVLLLGLAAAARRPSAVTKPFGQLVLLSL
jgi:hypothetical protein